MSKNDAALANYRNSPTEIARTQDLLAIVPKVFSSVLDIGARDGHFSQLLTQYFQTVTALDLVLPKFQFERVLQVQGNVTELQFIDSSFDVVFCTEVLEHIPELQKACSEIARVARHAIVLGVPFRQDTRVGRTTCSNCGRPNPPWGHVNSFDEQRVSRLFPGFQPTHKSFVGTSNERTNALSALLMDIAGNPWGVYEQEEPCIYCGKQMAQPSSRSFLAKVTSGLATQLNRIQTPFNRAHPNWIHVVFRKVQP